MLDEFIPPRAVGTSFGNTLVRRYLQNTKWMKNSTSPEEMKKFQAMSALFKQYSSQYGFDYLMMMAQGYQESLLNQSARNPSGAVGIMQVIPKYAAANPINVKDVKQAPGKYRGRRQDVAQHRGPIFQRSQHRPGEQDVNGVRQLQRRAPTGLPVCAHRPSNKGSIPISGSAMSSYWLPRTLARRPSLMSGTFTSTTSHTSWRCRTKKQ